MRVLKSLAVVVVGALTAIDVVTTHFVYSATESVVKTILVYQAVFVVNTAMAIGGVVGAALAYWFFWHTSRPQTSSVLPPPSRGKCAGEVYARQ